MLPTTGVAPEVADQPAISNCSFCLELSGADAGPYADRSGDRLSVSWQTPNWVVMPTLGPLAIGHVLALPRAHFRSYAAAALARDDADSVLSDVVGAVESAFGPTIAFEHGMLRPATSGGCGVDHAHAHVVPVRNDIRLPSVPGASFRRIRRISDAIALAGSASGYLYVRSTEGEEFAAAVEALPSQTLRRWVADALGVRCWDWRVPSSDKHVASTCMWVAVTPAPSSLSKP